MESYLVLRVSQECKTEFDQEIEKLTMEECEIVVRIGLSSLSLMRQSTYNSDVYDVKRKYQLLMEEKEKETKLLETVLWDNRDRFVQEKCKEYQEELDRYKLRLQASEKEFFLERERWQLSHKQTSDELLQLKEELIKSNEAKNAMELTSEIMIRNRVNDLLEEKRNYYQNIIDDLKQNIELYKTQCKNMELAFTQKENSKIQTLQEELQETKDQLHKLRFESESTKVDQLTSTIEKQQTQINEILNKRQSSVLLGQEGESYFRELVEEVFGNYEMFDIVDTTKMAHSGDFHLKFRDFTILTDTKNFIKGKVSTVDVNKFYYDMTRNSGIKIGWLVCLNGYVGNFAKQPFLFEIRDGSLLVFVNNLRNQENPGKLLEDIFYFSQFLYNTVINVESTTEVLDKYRRYERKMNDILARLVKQNKQINATIQQLKSDFSENEKLVNEMLHEDVMSLRNEHTLIVEDWFHERLERSEGSKIKSNIMYEKFIQTRGECGITVEMFKSILKQICNQENLQLPKQEKSQYILLGYRFKEI